MKRIERNAARESFARIEAEKNLMHVPDGFAHGGNRQAGNRADDHGQHNHTRFPRAHDGAQTARHFELTAEQAHGEQFNQAGNATGLNAMTLAGASDGFNAPIAASIVAHGAICDGYLGA